MLQEEAKWLGDFISSLDEEYFPMLNIGSSTAAYRKTIQPYIDSELFAPLQRQGKQVVHIDMKEDEGVDLSGDLNDEDFIHRLATLHAKSLLCCNLLEHVASPEVICARLEDVVEVGGLLIITAPHVYPYHLDPIDTKFRPNIEELSRLFPHCKLLEGTFITSKKTHAKQIANMLCTGYFIGIYVQMKRWLLPLNGLKEWKKRVSDIPNLFKPFAITCVVFEKVNK
jgi:hypothetical protein